jgi:hypothetical protein
MKVSDDYLLNLFRVVVGLKAGLRCEFPGCPAYGQDLNPHHHFGKDNAVRYDPECALWLCTPHHTGEKPSAHLTPLLFEEALLINNVRSLKWIEQGRIKQNSIVKNNDLYRVMWKKELLSQRDFYAL